MTMNQTREFVECAKKRGVSFWIDTADVELIQKATALGATGATTNPSLAAAQVKKGIYNELIRGFLDQLQGKGEIRQGMPKETVYGLVEFELRKHMALERVPLVTEDLSVEVNPLIDEMRLFSVAEKAALIYKEGTSLATLDSKVVIKIGFSEWGLLAAKRLKGDGIRVNMTLCFNEEAAILSALAGVYVVSMFLGRFDDWAGKSGLSHLTELVHRGTHAVHNTIDLFETLGLTQTRFVPASLRSAEHLVNTIYPYRTIPTIPPPVFLEQVEKLDSQTAQLEEKDLKSRHEKWIQKDRVNQIRSDFQKAFPDGLPPLEEAISFYQAKGRQSPFVDPFADQGVRMFSDQQAVLMQVIREIVDRQRS